MQPVSDCFVSIEDRMLQERCDLQASGVFRLKEDVCLGIPSC